MTAFATETRAKHFSSVGEADAATGVYSIKGCNGEEGVLITCPPPPRPVVTKMTQME